MRTILLCIVFLAILPVIPNSAAALTWNWHPSERGYYATIRDGLCHSGVTVFWADDLYGRGWRIAFDRRQWINLNTPHLDVAIAEANVRFYSEYCGTPRYSPTCPVGVLPLSAAGSCAMCASQ